MNGEGSKSGPFDVLSGVVSLSNRLPAPLAYGAAVVVTVAVLGLAGQRISDTALIVLALVFLGALVAFVYLDSRTRGGLKEPEVVVRDIRAAFNRSTFQESLRECATQDWLGRFKGTCETTVRLYELRAFDT